jgi:hypothetical protein
MARNCPKGHGIQKFRAITEGWTSKEKEEVIETLKKEGFSGSKE